MQRIARNVGPVIVIAVVVVIVLRLDTNGWGSLVFLVTVIGTTVIRAPFERENKANIITRKDNESSENLMLFGVGLGGSILPMLHLLTGVFSFADYDLPDWATALSLAGVMPGLYLFWRSHTDLGRNWSVTTEIREDHTLVTTGIYAKIRHPMYTAIWLLFGVMPLMVHNWIAGVAVIATYGVMCIVRIPREEQMMIDTFGEEYRAYMARTGRLLPKLRS